MVVLKTALARLGFALPVLFTSAATRAEDSPVEQPSVARPALPQAEPPAPTVVTQPTTTRPAAPQASSTTSSGSYRATRISAGRRGFLYLAAGPGVLTGLSGGKDFERTNPALSGAVGVQLPLSDVTGIGFELNADLELAGARDRGAYAAALLRLRLARSLSDNTRWWGAVGIGRAGYQIGSLAGSGSIGASYLFVPKFGLDVSANLNFLAAASDDSFKTVGVNYNYDGGMVLLIAVRALFELHH